MNNGNIEYPFDTNSNQYNLWKPSSAYFPRGEAPPPYEEAVAQGADTINAQCTVSVATTHSAPISTGTTMVESSFDVQPTAIATSTTNLININISNSGNITAVATGENHQINKCYSTIAPNAQLRLQPSTQPRSTQYTPLPLATNHTTEPQQRSPLAANVNQIEVFGSDLNAISTIATTTAETNTDALLCNYKNCSISNSLTKPKNRNDVVFQTPQHNRVKKNGEASLALMRNQPNNTILPPPLFDESTTMSTATLPLLPNDSIRQLKSRRHHRTIPRHFTLNDTANNPNATNPKTKANEEKTGQNCSGTATLNKKSICQCPVQHVPMTYMGSAYLNLTRNQQTNEMLLSTLTKKWSSQKAHVAKSASFTSTPSMASTNITTSSTALGYNRNSASGLLSAINPPKANSNGSSTAAETQTNAVHQPKTPSKISTISKQIGHNELNTIAHSQVQQHSNDSSNDVKSMQELLPISINNNGKASNSNPLNGSKIVANLEGDGMTLVPNATNPVLPPKLSKAQIFSRQAECVPSISKLTASTNCTSGLPANGLTMTSSLTNHYRLSGRERSKSPAADKTYSMVTPLNLGADQKIYHIKTTYPTTANLTLASNHFTFPKPSSVTKPLLSVKNQSNSQNMASSSQSKFLQSKVHSSSSKAKKIMPSSLHNNLNLRQELQTSDILNQTTNQIDAHRMRKTDNDKPLPVCTTFTNCSNPKEHFLPNDTSLDDDYLSECENCKSAHGSRYYLDEEHVDQPQETMTLQRKMDEKECDEQPYYRTSSTLPTNTKQKTTVIKNREPWFSTIPGSSSSEEDAIE
ncbi:rho GTPase-activating protein gacK-like [Sitodiplosis mosellana]|uniref:rho GTPase-activating protein gacK-like n=1 Tax=Sitodiplosis mosellana TaxID=263140 RepID=UPI0024447305|nr:rho GTPase-activating protein gacK-like [Sitodiplosis mosellana]